MGGFKDLTGEKINNWLVLEHKGFNKHNASLWLVECQCEKHTKRIKDISQLRATDSCGCKRIENLNGKTFGRLTVISDPIHKNGKIYFKCRCSCENKTITEVRADELKSGTSKSCGCYALELKTKTGMSRERIYGIWDGMIRRCNDKDNKRYLNYGARGITICKEWYDFLTFREWAFNNGYKDNLTIERIDVDKNYEPNNCTWITMKEQARNKTTTIYLTLDDGYSYKLIDLEKELGVNRETLLKRYKSGINNKILLSSKINIDNKSGIIGVSYSNDQNNWRAYINVDNKRIELGRRKDKLKAIKLRLEAELKYFGDNAPQKHLFKEYNIGDDIYE